MIDDDVETGEAVAFAAERRRAIEAVEMIARSGAMPEEVREIARTTAQQLRVLLDIPMTGDSRTDEPTEFALPKF